MYNVWMAGSNDARYDQVTRERGLSPYGGARMCASLLKL